MAAVGLAVREGRAGRRRAEGDLTAGRERPRLKADGAAFRRTLAARFPAAPAPGVAEVRLHLATPRSGLSRLADGDAEVATPYWAYAWGGGLALARHVLDRPETVRGRRVLDFGCGGGVVGIAAALAGAAAVRATDVDPYAAAATRVNAALNGVRVEAAAGPCPGPERGEVVLAGDVFYDAETAAASLAALRRFAAAGAEVWVGDPFRAHLPLEALNEVGRMQVADVSLGAGRTTAAGVFRLV